MPQQHLKQVSHHLELIQDKSAKKCITKPICLVSLSWSYMHNW